MTIDEARKKIVESIRTYYDQAEANNIAELLIEYITKLSRIENMLKKNQNLSASETENLDQSIQRLRNHEPVQYITQEAWFYGMKFYVDKNVLIPRPETEELADWVIKEVRSQKAGIAKILDIGTGSGCIAIALKKNLPRAEVWACDMSDPALSIARINADALGATVDFVPLDFLDPRQRKQLPAVDIVVSNPPYVPQRDKTEMKKNVVFFEPSTALFVSDNDPVIFYNAIADFGKEKLNDEGRIYVEIHETLGEQVRNLFLSKNYLSVQVKKDMQGKERMVRVNMSGLN